MARLPDYKEPKVTAAPPSPVEVLHPFQILPSEAVWKEKRRQHIGASEAAAVCGYNPFAGPVQVWDQKVNGTEIVPTRRMEIGHQFEPLAAKWYAEDTGRPVIDPGPYSVLVHKERPIEAATLDRLTFDENRGWGVLEIKWANVFQAPKWRDGEEAPQYYVMQVNHQIEVLRSHGIPVSWGALACILGTGDFRMVDIDYDPRMATAAATEYAWFWDHVQNGTMPPVDGMPSTKAILEAFYRVPEGSMVSVDPSDAEAVKQWADLKARYEAAQEKAKAATDAQDVIKNELRDALGRIGAELVNVPGVAAFKWATVNRKGYTVEPTSFRQIGISKPKAGRL